MAAPIDLGYAPRPWQREVHLGLADKRWGALVCHRRAGKTVLAVMHLVHLACTTKRNDGRYAYIAPFLKQAKAIAWKYIKQYTLKIPGAVANESELHVTLPNGAQIRVYGGDNADGLRGIYLDGVVLDETAQLDQDLWDSVLRPALSDRQGSALFLGTPNGINLLSEIYFKAQGRADWYAGLYTVEQTDALPIAEVADLKLEMSINAFRREYLCDFSAASEDTLIFVDAVETATKRHYSPEVIAYAPRVLGVDVARQGEDRSVCFPRQGLLAGDPLVWRGLDAMAVASQVARKADQWGPDAIFVDGTGGYGAGVIDRLRQLSYPVIEVQFGGSADDPRYANKRAEMWFLMSEWIKQGGKLPAIHELKQDLCAPRYRHNGRDQLIIEPKDDIKARGLPSPDLGDGLALTFAHPVMARNNPGDLLGQGGRKQASALSDYDPLAGL